MTLMYTSPGLSYVTLMLTSPGPRALPIWQEGGFCEGGFCRRTQLAVLRNPMARTTTYEAAFNKTDLLGTDPDHLRRWSEGLNFGFSFVINDGDDEAKQNGWAGYYPHAIVRGWNEGQKEPQKAGTVRKALPLVLPSAAARLINEPGPAPSALTVDCPRAALAGALGLCRCSSATKEGWRRGLLLPR